MERQAFGAWHRCVAVLVLLTVVVTATAFHAEGVAAADSGCPDDYPVPLTWQPGAAEAASEIAVCTDALGSAISFLNGGDLVWTITASCRGACVSYRTTTFEARAARAAIAEVYSYAVLGPGNWVIVRAPPSSVKITADDELSALWWTHTLLSDVITDRVGDWATMAASQRSKAFGTLATCALGAASAVDDFETLGTDKDVDQFLAAIGLASSGSTCARSWAGLVDDVDLPPWRRSVLSLTRSAAFLDDASIFLSRLNTLSKLIPRLP